MGDERAVCFFMYLSLLRQGAAVWTDERKFYPRRIGPEVEGKVDQQESDVKHEVVELPCSTLICI